MSSRSLRFAAVDALRGLIMMIMAIDHTNAFISRQHGSEFWNGAISIYQDAFPFLTRLVTHLCAPGFFFLMGAGIYWFASSRQDLGWTRGQVVRRTAIRGLAIFLVGQVFEPPFLFVMQTLKPPAAQLSRMPMAPPNDGTSIVWGLITLTGLGLVMLVAAGLLYLRPWIWLLVCAASVLSTHALLPAGGQVGPLWLTVLLAPGISHGMIVLYPVIPWLAVTAFGMYFGYWWKTTPTAQQQVWILGAAVLLSGLCVRALGDWGNIQPARDAGWIEFLNNVKYPPSLVFWTISVGVDLLLLAVLMRLPDWVKTVQSPLLVFGQTPLFFYVVHFYVLMAATKLFVPEALPLPATYAVWAVLLAVMYPICRWYREFKLGKPQESLWRLF